MDPPDFPTPHEFGPTGRRVKGKSPSEQEDAFFFHKHPPFE